MYKLSCTCGEINVLFEYWKKMLSQNRISLLSNFFSKNRIILRCHRALKLLPEIYQPILVPGFSHLKPKRACFDRLKLINDDLNDPHVTINDIGCQIGFFSFSLSDRGNEVSGFDSNLENITICNMLNELGYFSYKPVFKNIPFTMETADYFNTVDYTLCLSLFHHIIYFSGLPVAQKLLTVLRKKTRKMLYFEMGQSNEPVEPWSKCLPDMGSIPLNWIVDFLKKGGFNQVKVLGLMKTHVSDVPRYLVAAC